MTDIDGNLERRTVLKTVGASGVAFTMAGVAGCMDDVSPVGSDGGGTDEEFVPGDRDFSGTTVTWYDHESGTLPALQAAAEQWEEQTGGTVNFEVFSPTDLRDKESTLFSTGSSDIDVVGYPYQWGAQYVAGGHLEALDGYVERIDSGWEQSDFIERVWEIYGQFEDGLYALPTKFDLWLAFWNKDHFEEAGLDPESPPETWDELEEYAAELDTDDHAGFDQTWVVGQSELNFLLQLRTRGVKFYDDNGYPAFWKEENRDKAIESIESWRRITEHSSNGYSTLSFADSTSVFTQGETALTYKWNGFAPGMLDPEESQVADSLGWGLTAGDENRNQMLGGWGAGVSAYSGQKEAAFDVLAFALNKQNSLTGAQEHGMSSARESVLTDEQVQESQPYLPTAVDALKNSFNRPKSLGWMAAKTTVGESVQTLITDRDADVESELKSMASEVWEISEDYGASPGDTGPKP